MTDTNARAEEILDFWFGTLDDAYAMDPSRIRIWFGGGADFDAQVSERFGADVERALAGELDGWAETARGRLGLVILLDQFTRNAFRDTPRMYAGDEKALALVREGVARGHDRELRTIERQFLYMPFMHAEDRDAQREGVALAHRMRDELPEEHRPKFAGFFEHSDKHAAVVERFGRFPHRNEILGRESTPEETAFLESEGRGF